MTAAKIAVSLPPAILARARRAVRAREATSVSAFIAAAIEHKADGDDLRRMFDEIYAETGGAPTPAEREAVRRELGLASPRPRRRRRK